MEREAAAYQLFSYPEATPPFELECFSKKSGCLSEATTAAGIEACLARKNPCESVCDCMGLKKCKNPSKCRCNTGKCRKKKKDCKTRGQGMEWWGCRNGQECVAKMNNAGKPKMWGKCKTVE